MSSQSNEIVYYSKKQSSRCFHKICKIIIWHR